MPPSVEDFIKEGHLSRSISEVFDRLDITSIEKRYSYLGQKSYHPRLLLKLWIYATGTFSLIDESSANSTKLKSDSSAKENIETIKIVTHSMGTGYSRGYVTAFNDYVENYNKKNPNSKISGFKFEQQVDIAAFQGSDLPAIPGIPTYNMNGDKDDVANGYGGKPLRILSPSSKVPNAKIITTRRGTTHSIKDYGDDYSIQQIPRGLNPANEIKPGDIKISKSDATRVQPRIGVIIN